MALFTLNGVSTTNANTNYTVAFTSNTSAFPSQERDGSAPYFSVLEVGSVHIGYRALRTDTTQTILVIDGETNREATLGEATHDNPLGLGVQIANANTTGVIKALAVASDDLSGYLEALDVLESDNSVYGLVPLTQEESVIAAFQAHVDQLSTPVEGAWRVAIVNSEIPTQIYLGTGRPELPATAYAKQTNASGTVNDVTFFIDPDQDFLSAGVVPTDVVTVMTFAVDGATQTLPNGTTASAFIGQWIVDTVIDAHTLKVVSADPGYAYSGTTGTEQSNGQYLPIYITRKLTKAEQATQVAKTSAQFNDKRVWHVMPDSVSVDVNGVTTAGLPGYYLCAGLGGMTSGFPVQQGFTNIGVAGIVDLQNSNYYFNRTSLNEMAGSGTCLFVQNTQGGIPYCRHELTTDMSTLEYREMLKVKNWDFLSYFYRDKLKSFIGSWNITPETLNTIRTTIIAASELLMTQKLPKIGPPLLSYQIVTLEQNAVNKDRITVKIRIEIVSPANYIDVDLEI